MKLDKIRFARLIGYISAASGHDFAPDEVDYIDRIIDVDVPEVKAVKANASDVDELMLCEHCNGTGDMSNDDAYYCFEATGERPNQRFGCVPCDGTGEV